MVVSIDLWGTLIKSSPSFQEAKCILLKEYFDNTEEEILNAFAETKREFNTIIESVGWQPKRKHLWKHLANKLHPKHLPVDIFELCREYQALVLKHPPLIYSDITDEYLHKLHKITTVLVLSSNTMFIEGETLEKIIPVNIFGHTAYSNRMGIAKPKPSMFFNSKYHIGDNERTDGIGAKNAGSIPIIINSNDKTIKDAYDLIAQHANLS